MQYLGDNRPQTFADLIQPQVAGLLAAKLLTAFRKIIWKCPGLNPDSLPPAERNIYQNGRVHEHWKVQRKDYCSQSEFKRVEKERSSEKESYKAIVERHWLSEPPDYLECLISEQLNRYEELMHTRIYQTLVAVCLERWQRIGDRPDTIRLPNRLKLPPLSEIYPLYMSSSPTILTQPPSQFVLPFDASGWPDERVGNQKGKTTNPVLNPLACKSAGRKSGTEEVAQTYKRQRQSVRNELRRVEKAINAPGGINYLLDGMTSMLSVRTRVALAHSGQFLTELRRSDEAPSRHWKPTTLFTE